MPRKKKLRPERKPAAAVERPVGVTLYCSDAPELEAAAMAFIAEQQERGFALDGTVTLFTKEGRGAPKLTRAERRARGAKRLELATRLRSRYHELRGQGMKSIDAYLQVAEEFEVSDRTARGLIALAGKPT